MTPDDPTDPPYVVHNLRVPMRDGTSLALDLLRPDLAGPRPVALCRTPYDKVNVREAELAQHLAGQGYIVATNDCRGRFNSDGDFRPYMGEADDGYDTVEWIADQDWCDGNVGMFGLSYAAQTTWYAASRRPPHLKAIVPMCSPPSSLWRNEPFHGGCFLLAMTEWMGVMGQRSWQQTVAQMGSIFTEQQPCFEATPLSAAAEVIGMRSEWWDEWMAHPAYDEFWAQGEYGDYAAIDVAALNITGWWDMNFPGAPLNYEAMRSRSPARDQQKLVIGPWPHIVNQHRQLNGIDFGPHATINLFDDVVRFFDRWLKGHPNGIENEPPVNIFVTGVNEWRAVEDWPLPDAEPVAYYLRSDGHANSASGDGTLATSPPADEPADHYRYDPETTPRILWSVQDGPVDDQAATAGEDCLCYTSDALSEPVEVIGWVTCHLFASSSALDTDWHVRLVDVHPNGEARFLCRGALRARFRDSISAPKLLTPGEPTRFDIDMDACGHRFLAGHRIRIEIASAWFTRYDRNRNTGTDNFFTDASSVVAEQIVYHEADRASYVLLPVVPRSHH